MKHVTQERKWLLCEQKIQATQLMRAQENPAIPAVVCTDQALGLLQLYGMDSWHRW